ncbi:unnamed protein product [Symbiodinium sp. CCMP2456]|nr:unnamed protein product [Symbiodinium sp. CCMP2456]
MANSSVVGPALATQDACAQKASSPSKGVKRRRLSMSLSTTSQTRKVARRAIAAPFSRPCPTEAVDAGALTPLSFGPYWGIAAFLDTRSLGRMDRACRLLRRLNNVQEGPWHHVGLQTFFGMEIDEGGFKLFKACGAENWKARCEKFRKITPTFSPPFSGSEIAKVDSPDEVAYCRCRLRSDILKEKPEIGIYVEVEVSANADNLSLAVVDFENGGRSSVTFSPETGAVLRERKVRESPRAIEGTYIHLLPPAPPGRKFEGAMGLYLQGGQLAFFRRWRVAMDNASHTATPNAEMQWETTGFCTDLKWAQGPRLSLCLAFRDSGAYRALITQVNNTPPIQPSLSADAYKESKWSLLYGDDDHPLAI